MANLGPRGTRILDRDFATELEAAWFAANQFYTATERNRVEYGGHIFARADGRYVLSAFRSKSAHKIRIPAESFQGLNVTALWHTHPPVGVAFVDALDYLLKKGQYFFSADDLDAVRQHPSRAIYLLTDRLIKRYRPNGRPQERWWPKAAAPSLGRLRGR